jgi:hypothetical protein
MCQYVSQTGDRLTVPLPRSEHVPCQYLRPMYLFHTILTCAYMQEVGPEPGFSKKKREIDISKASQVVVSAQWTYRAKQTNEAVSVKSFSLAKPCGKATKLRADPSDVLVYAQCLSFRCKVNNNQERKIKRHIRVSKLWAGRDHRVYMTRDDLTRCKGLRFI